MGPKSKIEEQHFVEGSEEPEDQKMARFHRETKRRSNLKFATNRQTDRQTDRVNNKKIIDSWARRGDQQTRVIQYLMTKLKDELISRAKPTLTCWLEVDRKRKFYFRPKPKVGRK